MDKLLSSGWKEHSEKQTIKHTILRRFVVQGGRDVLSKTSILSQVSDKSARNEMAGELKQCMLVSEICFWYRGIFILVQKQN